MLNEVEKKKLVQIVDMAIDTRDYFAIRSRLQSYLNKEKPNHRKLCRLLVWAGWQKSRKYRDGRC